ncbi:MAG: SEL1-like repeat protein [Rhizobiaceae bacterium]|nr:SEL1-like repeat protein [Rhizobiaceae bacterium]
MFTRLTPRRLPILVIFAAVVSFSSNAAEAAKRVALLIGNQDYKATTPLRNPANDVELMRKTLKDAGFDEVDVALDVDLVGMKKALRAFEDKAYGSDVAVLYYSGHGIEMGGTNYLIPTDAVLRSDRDVEDEALALERAERSLNGATRLKLVILDACRNNPFLETMQASTGTRTVQKGLAKVEPEGADTLVAYASRAGTVALDGAGLNSPFAQALAKYIAQPGVDIRIALGQVRDEVVKVTQRKQEPFVYGSLGGAQIYLSIKELNVTVNNNNTTDKTETKKEEVAPNGISSAAADWQNIKDLADKELLEAFIAKHGADPVYKMLAEKKLKLIAEAEAKADVSADQIAWEALKGSTDVAAIKRFMERYPESRFKGEAEQAIASLAPAQNQSVVSSDMKDTPASRDCYLLAAEPQSMTGFPGVYLTKIDAKRALTACAQAVNENPEDAMLINLLGRAHEADRNYTEARRNYTKASELGNLYAATNLGWFSVYGIDGPVNVEEGKKAFEKAAISGNHAAQASLAFLYRDGYGGTEQNNAEAIRWYEKAAEQGNATALGNLGWFYREGVGIQKDYQKSLGYYRRGADAGDLSSIAAMGYAAQNGLGMPQSYDEARKWYEKGANAGDAYSMASLGFLYDAGAGVKQDYVEARYWYEKAADAGSAYAMGNLSRLYDQGLGTSVDAKEAVRWAVAAVERGDTGKLDELKTSPGNFSANFRKEFQKVLKERGYFRGVVNGDFGADTMIAIDSLAAGKDLNPVQTNNNAGVGISSSGNVEGNTVKNDNGVSTSIADAITFRPNVKSQTADARECYALAGEPGSEPNFPGVLFADIQIRKAIDVCTRAVEQDPRDSMLYDMLGRAYDMDRNYEQARRWYQKAVDLGNSHAYSNMAWLSIYGNGEPQDMQKGMRMMERAANAGNSYAQASLGWVYREGYGGISKNLKVAFDWYIKAAGQGYANAQASVGYLYREGLGVDRDYVKSLDFYRKAALQGDINAMGSVGYALQNGLGADVDFEEARYWYEKAVEKNDPYSLSALAWLYREGKGVRQDYGRALDLYRRAAEKNDVNGMSSLGYMAQYGLGMPVNYREALRWYEMAIAQNDPYAFSALGYMYREGAGVQRDYAKSLDYYRRGAELGDLNSMGSMGYALQNGLGTPINYQEARQWYEKAAEREDPYSMASLAWLYENGKGVRQDYQQAKSWYEKAANGGNAYAMGNLSYLYDRGMGTRQDARQAARLAVSSMEGGEKPFISDMKNGARNYSPEFRQEVQRLLRERGYYSGPIDGIFGVTTSAAIDRLTGSRS